ncbi:MAG: hypothetical protein WC123_07655 [Bacilli bacterium]
MEKTTIKIDNLFFAIVESTNYKNISDKYDNASQAQKDILKNALIPKVKQVITEIINNNENFECIQLEKLTSKYNKNEKYLKLELIYNDERENINYIYNIFKNFRNELWNKLLPYQLYMA